jgi:hypothetical protein
MREVTINNNVYTIGQLGARQQFHIARRLGPAIFSMAKGAVEIGDDSSIPEEMKAFTAFGPLVEVLAKMPDEDADYVLDTCLSVVRRQQSVGTNVSWAHVFIPGSGMAFKDIDMPTMMNLAINVIQDNIGNFMPALLGSPSLTGADMTSKQ